MRDLDGRQRHMQDQDFQTVDQRGERGGDEQHDTSAEGQVGQHPHTERGEQIQRQSHQRQQPVFAPLTRQRQSLPVFRQHQLVRAHIDADEPGHEVIAQAI